MDEQHLADLVASIDRRQRRFPPDAACADCGERNRLLLCREGKAVVCYGCRLVRQGREPVERHHVGGRPSTLLMPLPANLHRLLTVLQELWRGVLEPGSTEAQLVDLFLLRVLGPSFGVS
jgi:hypothetical protein